MSDLVRNYPVIFLPLQNNVEQSFGKDDNELKRVYTILNSLRGMYYGGTPPTSPNVGDKWHDSSTNIIKQWNGSTWAVFLESTSQLTGVLNEALGAPIASATTINLTTATGNFLHITGTTTITAVTLGAGMRREIIFDGILTLTHHATNNNLPGGANITTAVGDRASYYSDGTTVYCTKYERADGKAVVGSGNGFFRNLKIIVTSNTQATVTFDYACLYGGTEINNLSVTLDTTILGAVNGLDTGTIANSTWYNVWAIAKADGTKGVLMSLSSTTPTMPSGYIDKIRIGAIRAHTDGTLLRTLQYGRNVQYVITASTNTPNMPIMASGVAGSISVPTWVGVSVSSFVPPTAYKTTMTAITVANAVIVAPNNNYGAYNSATNPPPFMINSTGAIIDSYSVVLESTSIYWASAVAAGKLFCSGWEDNL